MTSRKDLSVSERIAALQRGTSPQPGGRPTSPPGTPPNVTTSHRLKDKIAHFDALGSAPKPSGSFGLGAPVEHRTTSRELYGNRIAGVNPKTGRSIGSSKDLSLLSNSSTSSLDRDAFARDSASNHSNEAPEGNTSPATENSQTSHRTEPVNVPEIRRTDSMTEHWVDTLQSKPGLALDTLAAESSGVFAPPSPIPESDDTPASVGPSTPLTSTLIKHLGASSHVPSRLGTETPISVMVETGSLADGEQPQLVPDDPGTIPPSPVVTGMQLLDLEDGGRAEGETTPTREDSEAGEITQPAAVAASLAPPGASRPAEEGPNTPLARSVNVEGPIALGNDRQPPLSSLGISTGERHVSQGGELTATNLRHLNAESSRLAPIPVAPSGPSSVVVEASSEAPSSRPSPSPEQQQPGAHTPEPASAITPRQGVSELPALAPGTLPLSAASLRLLDIEGGKKSGRSGTETPISIMVETGSDGTPRDLEGVEPPIATPAPASPATSYFEEPTPGVVVQPVGADESNASKAFSSSVNSANPEPDNRIAKQGLPVSAKAIPTIVTNVRYRSQTTGAMSVDQTDSSALETPTNKTFARTPNTIHKARSRPDISSTSMSSDPAPTGPTQAQTLAVPNAGLQRRATTGSATKTAQRRRVSRVPQMQLLPSGQWGVVDDDSDEEEDTGGWAKVTVTRTKWS